MAKVFIIDTTNRDGVQSPRLSLSKLQKTIINLMLDEAGIFASEFGFPTTKHELNYLNTNLKLLKQRAIKHLRLSGWVRALPEDVSMSLRNVFGLDRLNISISTSEQMLKHKFKGRFDHASLIASAVSAVRLAKSRGVKEVVLGAEDASRSDLRYLIEFFIAAKNAGADRIRYSDTLGYDTPFSIYERVSMIAKKLRMPMEIHSHNDLGLAVSNSVAGAKAVIDCGFDAYINVSVNGVGERAGNADMMSVIRAFKLASGMKVYKLAGNIDMDKVESLCRYAAYAFGGGHYNENVRLKIPPELYGLACYARLHNQKPLIKRELDFITRYPEAARQIIIC